jgi:RHS repeat-associated protein
MSGCPVASDSLRLVGDPVDVVTGACVEVNWEFELRGPLPLVFRRHYDSTRRTRHFALGWGHSHDYERSLAFDVDGLRYSMAVARPVAFPPLPEDGDEAAAQGLRLRRIEALRYQLAASDGTVSEFVFDSPSTPAPIQSLRRGGDSIRFGYDPLGRLSSIIDSAGRFIRVDSDAQGHLLALTLISDDGRAQKPLLRLAYHETGYLASGVDTHGNTFSFDYDQRGRVIRKTDRRGYSFIYQYDEQDRCVRSSGVDGLHDVQLRYMPDERATIVTKADGGEWTYLYDEQGTITRIIDPYGGARSFEVGENGRVTKEIDPNGNEFEWVYDASGAKLGRRSPFGELLRDPNVPVVPTARAHRIPRSPLEWEYGHLLRRDRIVPLRPGDPALRDVEPGIRERLWTTPAGVQPDDNGFDTRREGNRSFDLAGLRILEHKPAHPPRRWLYDAGANARRYHDHDGSMHGYEYESWDLRSAHVDPIGNTTRYTHTSTGRVESVTDPGGTRTEYEYDLKDRLCRISRHGGFCEEYRYDEADNLVDKLDRNGDSLLRFEIGPGGAKIARHLAYGGTHRFEYDERGRYTKAATDDFETTFEYDALGQRIADERDGKGVRHAFRRYGALATTIVLGRFKISYERLATSLVIADPTGARHRIDHSRVGIVRRALSNGTSETVQFDLDGRVRLRHVRHEGRRIDWARSYHYSGEGDLLDIRDDQAGRTRFEYDRSHRLRSVVHRAGNVARYRHDPAGNLLEQPGLSDVRVGSGNRIGAANGETFEYGHRDQVVQRRRGERVIEYRYDARDILVGASDGTYDWHAEYDPLGRRIRKSFENQRFEFYWDTDRLAAEISADGRLRIYVYSDAFAMVPMMFIDYDSIDADPRTGKRHFIFCDHISTPVRVEDDSGAVVWKANVEPYGQCEVSEDSQLRFALRFPGHYFDEETGLHYNRFRSYDPVLGRYLQPDPLGVEAGTNLYAYARSNPLKWVDLRGDCPTGAPDDDDDDPRSPEDGADSQAPAALAGGKYDDITIEMTGLGRSVDERYDVRIYDPAELESRRVVAGSDGRLVYASDGRSVDSGDQPVIYVMDRNGNFYVDEPRHGDVHHSSLAGGDNPAAAGEMQVVDGQIIEMNERTGHYGGEGHQPPGRVDTAASELSDQGVDTSNAELKRYGES